MSPRNCKSVDVLDEAHIPEFKWNGLLSWFAGVGIGIGLGLIGGSLDTFAAPATLAVSGLLYRATHARGSAALASR